MSDRENQKNERHTREWQDRARVVLDAKKGGTYRSVTKSKPGFR